LFGDASRGGKSRFPQGEERMRQQCRGKASVVVFHRKARAGEQMVFGLAFARKPGSADDPRAVGEQETVRFVFFVEHLLERRFEKRADFSKKRIPIGIESECAQDNGADGVAVFSGRAANDVGRGKRRAWVGAFCQIPRKMRPMDLLLHRVNLLSGRECESNARVSILPAG